MSQLKHVRCPVCEKGILTVVAEFGVEAQGTTAMFQSLSDAYIKSKSKLSIQWIVDLSFFSFPKIEMNKGLTACKLDYLDLILF
jgi:hypothetical protein